MSETARGRWQSCSLVGATLHRYRDQIRRTRSEAVVMVIPESYVEYYARHIE